MIDEYVKLISCFHQINFCGGKDKTIFQNATKNKKEIIYNLLLYTLRDSNPGMIFRAFPF